MVEKCLKTNIRLNDNEIYLFIFNELNNPVIDSYNRMLWLAKFFIYKKRKEKEEIDLYRFLNFVSLHIQHEKQKCSTDREYTNIKSRWSLIENYI